MGYRAPEPLGPHHELRGFACGEPALDEWLERHAWASHAGASGRVYVTTTLDDPRTIVGYYVLAAAQIEPADATVRVARGQPSRRPIPVVLLARLAVDRAHQGRRVGSSLLRDALLRVLHAADAIGVRALVVHAKHDRARVWYEQYGFEPSPSDPLHLILLLKDLRRVLGRPAGS